METVVPTKGQKLKKQLGLSIYPNVKIHRYISSLYRFYFVYYDSRLPNRLIPYTEIKNLPYVQVMLRSPGFSRDNARFTPTMRIEDWNGDLEHGMFFAYDLAGRYGMREGGAIFRGRINEFVRLTDLNTPEALSTFTKGTRKERNDALKTENELAKLVDVLLDTVEDHVTFVFKTQATTPIYPDDHTFKRSNPKKDHSLERNPEKKYEMYIRILDFYKWLEAQGVDKKALSRKDIKEILDVSNVQVYSTSPSFHWQSMNYNLSILDGSIYPTKVKPKQWDKIHGDAAFLDKHLYGLLRYIGFFENQMAAMLTKRLRQRGEI